MDTRLDELSTWHTLLQISATMLGLLLVVMSMIINGRDDRRLTPEDARALMIASAGSSFMFLLTLGVGLGVIVREDAVDWVRQMGLLYFILGFGVTVIILSIILYQWFKRDS